MEFTLDGIAYTLATILESPTDTDFFMIFKDKTNGKETYGMRYLLCSVPESWTNPSSQDNRVVLDFNRSYNPPCSFTDYAACPVPPAQNSLPIRIEAGELKYSGSSH